MFYHGGPISINRERPLNCEISEASWKCLWKRYWLIESCTICHEEDQTQTFIWLNDLANSFTGFVFNLNTNESLKITCYLLYKWHFTGNYWLLDRTNAMEVSNQVSYIRMKLLLVLLFVSEFRLAKKIILWDFHPVLRARFETGAAWVLTKLIAKT